MPQMLAIQPAAPKAPPQAPAAGSPGNKEQSKFSPHLEKAISNKKLQQQATQDKSHKDTPSSADKNSLADGTSSPTDKNNLTDDNSQSLEPKKAKTIKTTDSPANAQAKGTPEQTHVVASAETEIPLPIATNATLPGSEQLESPATFFQNTSAVPGNETNKSGKAIPPFTITPDPSSTVAEPVVLVRMKPLTATGQDTLISQLQSIIDNSDETGTVSITKVGNSAIPNSINSNIHGLTAATLANTTQPVIIPTTPENSELNLNGILLVAEVDGAEKTASKPMQQLHGIRNDTQQQYFNTKINTQNLAENNPNSQENKKGNDLSKQTAHSIPQSGQLSAAQSMNTFSQILVGPEQTTPQPTNVPTQPILLPSGTIVHEEDVIRQLTERFQVSSKHMDSRINLKLHPAELGELKIDLTVKDGSIKANIVAQSQHTLDILHKNIPKLRTLLENQGFTIDQISVTAESDSVGGFDLFDRQLFNHDDYTPTAQKGHSEAEVGFILANNEYSAPATRSGVNVKI